MKPAFSAAPFSNAPALTVILARRLNAGTLGGDRNAWPMPGQPVAVLVPMSALGRKPSGWTGRGLCSSVRPQSASPGGVAERLNAPVLKTGVLSRGPWVRIPPPPPETGDDLVGMRTHGQIDKWVRRLCGAKSDTGASATVVPSPRGMSNAPALLTIPPPPPETGDDLVGMRTHGQLGACSQASAASADSRRWRNARNCEP